jgi:hypothetical protein
MYRGIATQRTISVHESSNRRPSQCRVSRVRNDSSNYSRMELDSHADTVVLGRNTVVLHYTGRECDVSHYSDTYKSITGVPIVTGATAWTCQFSGTTYILVFNEALWMGEVLDYSLINPNQLRQFGVVVQDNPFSADEMHIATEDESLFIPLTSQGTTIFMNTRTPTDKELQDCHHIELTSRSP